MRASRKASEQSETLLPSGALLKQWNNHCKAMRPPAKPEGGTMAQPGGFASTTTLFFSSPTLSLLYPNPPVQGQT